MPHKEWLWDQTCPKMGRYSIKKFFNTTFFFPWNVILVFQVVVCIGMYTELNHGRLEKNQATNKMWKEERTWNKPRAEKGKQKKVEKEW